MSILEGKIVKPNDEIDLISLFSILLDNFNFLLSIFIASIFATLVFYLSSTNIYYSNSLLEIQDDGSKISSEYFNPLAGNSNSLEAELEIYKSNQTISDVADKLLIKFPEDDIPTKDQILSGLNISSDDKTLIQVSFSFKDQNLTKIVLDELNNEYIQDRKNFRKKSSAAGKKFIQEEIPRVKNLLSTAEENLNSFKLSTNTADVIFDSESRNEKLRSLQERIDEINFKELELKEFYKESHPIYVTLSEQKTMLLNQVNEIEEDLPNIPNNQRKLENLKREVNLYVDVISKLSEQEIGLSMAEASSLSNVRIINFASNPIKISPNSIIILIYPLFASILFYFILAVRHFISDKITNLDALIDFIGKENVIGELPFLELKSKRKEEISKNIADELLNKTVYEITHSTQDFSSICVLGSRKNVGKTEISLRLFDKLSKRNLKVCLLDLDYRKRSLTNRFFPETIPEITTFDQFYENIESFKEGKSLFVPAFKISNPQDFFLSDEFNSNIESLKKDYDYVICDTPPWSLFVDAKIVSKCFEKHLFVIGSNISTFKDIKMFQEDIQDLSNIFYFFNKFTYFFNFLWYQYEYPYYSGKSYYDYKSYTSLKKDNKILQKIRHYYFFLLKKIFK